MLWQGVRTGTSLAGILPGVVKMPRRVWGYNPVQDDQSDFTLALHGVVSPEGAEVIYADLGYWAISGAHRHELGRDLAGGGEDAHNPV